MEMNYFSLINNQQNIFYLVSIVLLFLGCLAEESQTPKITAASGRADETRVLPSIVTYRGNKVICQNGWTPARSSSGVSVGFVCMKLYRHAETWTKAQDICRADNSFLLKMESRIAVGPNFLNAILENEGIHSVWSGLHVDETKLIWDEMKPKLFQPRLGMSKAFGILKRGWKWEPGTFDDVSLTKTCGLYSTGKKAQVRIRRETSSVNNNSTGSSSGVNKNKKTERESSLSEKIAEEQQDDDSEDVPITTPTLPANVTESKEDTTDSTSKEETTEKASKENVSKTFTRLQTTSAAKAAKITITENYQTTTQQTTLDFKAFSERTKRSTAKQTDLVTTILPTTIQTTVKPDSPTTFRNLTTTENQSTVTQAPIPTASAPAKGTSGSTLPTDLFTGKTDKASVEVTDSPQNESEALEDDEAKTSAATLPEKPSSSESQVANPLFSVNSISVPSVVSQIDAIKPTMELDDCEKDHPFICYNDPIQELHPDPHCGLDWMSHNYLDKCYRVIETPLTRSEAANNCYKLGGRLADAYHDFYGNITAMAFSFHPKKAMLGTHVWVEKSEARATMCDAITGYTFSKVNCETKLASVCEKLVPDSDLSDTKGFEDFLDTSDKMQILYMTSANPGLLICPLMSSSPEDMVLWYKDGILIKDFDSMYINNQFNLGNQNRFSGNLRLDLSLFQRLEDNKAQNEQRLMQLPSMLQGKYWCEVWRRKPFQKIKSRKHLVRYTDVITLFGTIQTKEINSTDAALFNLMDREVGLPRRILVDLSYMNNNITVTMRSKQPLFNNVASKLYHVDSKKGRVEFHTYITLTQDMMPEIFKSKMVSIYLKLLNSAILANAETLVRNWNIKPPVASHIFISRTDVCPRKHLVDDVSGFGATFPTTSVNTTSNSEEECRGKPSGSAQCIGNLEERAYWKDWIVDRRCNRIPDPPSSEEYVEGDSEGFNTDEIIKLNGDSISAPIPTANPGLAQLDEIAIEKENAEDVSDKMAEIMDHADSLTEEDINRIAKVIERINTVSKPSIKVGENLVKTVNKVLETNDKVLVQAEKGSQSATKIIANLEEIANKANMGKQKRVRLVTPNVAMEIWNLEKEDENAPVIGLGAMVADSWTVELSDTRIKTIVNRTDLHEFDVAIELPESLISNSIKDHNGTRLTMFIYKKVGLFASDAEKDHSVVNSPVVSASVGGQKIQNLEEKIRMIFRPFQDSPNRENITKCVYWDFSINNNKGGWSSNGCEYAGTLDDRDICLCDHLTNFAVLLDFYGHAEQLDPIHDFALSIITIIGLSLSIFGLGMTIVTFIFFSKLRQGRAQQTLFHMALSLLGSELVFLIGIRQIDYYGICLTVAILLHYFILVSFMWMLVEAILQYLTFVKVLGTYISRYALKTALPAWGIPLIPVCIVLGIDYNLYKGWDTYCWMKLDAFYYAFALPVGCIIIFNIIMFIIIIISLGRRPRGLRAHHGKTNTSTSKTNLKAAVTIFVLLGLTWAFGYLAISDARLIFQYIFTFLSSLQGFFIFILMVARRKQIRDQWAVICCKDRKGSGKRKSVSATNSNSTSSNSSGGSGASRRSLYKNKCRNGSIETIVSDCRFESLYYIPTSSIPTRNLQKHKPDDYTDEPTLN